MSTHIAKQILARTKAKNMSVRALEIEAGLKARALHNVVRGTSKKPSAELLQAVSDVLGCTVKDLLTKQKDFQEGESAKPKNEVLRDKYEHPALLSETVTLINAKIQEKGCKLTVDQVLTCIEEVYVHSLQTNPEKVDQEFTEWFIDLLTS